MIVVMSFVNGAVVVSSIDTAIVAPVVNGIVVVFVVNAVVCALVVSGTIVVDGELVSTIDSSKIKIASIFLWICDRANLLLVSIPMPMLINHFFALIQQHLKRI